MASVAKRAAKLVFAAIFLALCMIGWVARATLAQDGKQDPAPPAVPAATPAELLPTLQDTPEPPSEAVKPPPLVDPTAIPGNAPALISESPVTQFVGAASTEPASTKTEPPAPSKDPELNPELNANNSVRSASEDPEKAAMAFVEQNQKMAESQLTKLKAEETKLRDRLRKVEAGIKRWESLRGALKQSQGIVAVVVPGNPGNWKQAERDDPPPQVLEPVPMPKSKLVGDKK